MRKKSECEKGYKRWISPSNKPHRVDSGSLNDILEYVMERASVSDKNSKDWATEGDAIQSAYRNGMWYAYHDVENKLRSLDLNDYRLENHALRDAINSLKDFVDGKRNDHENISEILNGALKL